MIVSSLSMHRTVHAKCFSLQLRAAAGLGTVQVASVIGMAAAKASAMQCAAMRMASLLGLAWISDARGKD
jgi:hypothetical protein